MGNGAAPRLARLVSKCGVGGPETKVILPDGSELEGIFSVGFGIETPGAEAELSVGLAFAECDVEGVLACYRHGRRVAKVVYTDGEEEVFGEVSATDEYRLDEKLLAAMGASDVLTVWVGSHGFIDRAELEVGVVGTRLDVPPGLTAPKVRDQMVAGELVIKAAGDANWPEAGPDSLWNSPPLTIEPAEDDGSIYRWEDVAEVRPRLVHRIKGVFEDNWDAPSDEVLKLAREMLVNNARRSGHLLVRAEDPPKELDRAAFKREREIIAERERGPAPETAPEPEKPDPWKPRFE